MVFSQTKWNVFFILGFLLLSQQSLAQTATFSSGERQVSLIELYSSEGCSSCPPADRWVAGLKDNGKLWKEFVPINFHVDYWNRLGWVDRFSNKNFSKRQRRFAAEWGSGRVYTPGFVKNGEEWRSRSLSNLKGSKVGSLIAISRGQGRYQVSFAPEGKATKNYMVHVALLGHGLSTKVKYGENSGETLRHEFVVLKTIKKAMQPRDGKYSVEIKAPTNSKVAATKFSLAFWVSVKGSQKPIQATGGYIAKK